MKYEDDVLNKIGIINSVFNDLNTPALFENNNFEIDYSFHYEHYVKFNLKKEGAIKLSLIIINNTLQINIDRINEAFEWSNSQIEENKENIIDFIKMIFTSKIKVEYCGSNYTKIYFINHIGEIVKTLKYVRGLYLKLNCRNKEYSPIYTI